MNNQEVRKKKIEHHFRQIMTLLGLDITDQSLRDTPRRVAKMWVDETCSGLFSPPPEVTMFDLGENDSRDLIIIRDIHFSSLCEHHFLPFVGTAIVAYLPRDHYMGLSKAARVVEHFAARPQVQERLTAQVADFLFEKLNPKGLLVMISAEHHCMSTRGVKKHNSSTITTAIRGEIDKQEVIASLQLT